MYLLLTHSHVVGFGLGELVETVRIFHWTQRQPCVCVCVPFAGSRDGMGKRGLGRLDMFEFAFAASMARFSFTRFSTLHRL